MTVRTLGLVPLVAATAAFAGSINLNNYTLAGRFDLPSITASEASAVTYNWDTGTLFVLGDEGDAVVEVNAQGQQLSVMTLTNFVDTEGLTYVGGGKFVITEERLQNAYQFTYTAGGSMSSAAMPQVDIGPTIGNIGIEGLSFDPRDGSFVLVKEKTPQAVTLGNMNFTNGTGSFNPLFVPNLGVLDLSDVQVLSTVPSLQGGTEDNLLIYSQESAKLLEVTRSGVILSQFDFSGLAGDAEGVTIGPDGTIYVVGEKPEIFVLVPAPSTAALLALGAFAARRRR